MKKESPPDPAIIAVPCALARQAAREDHEAEMKAAREARAREAEKRK